MKLTTKSEYILLALIYIAKNQNDGYVKIEDICDKYKLRKKYLEQLFYLAKQQKLIFAKRGSLGGYRLTRRANKISVAEIIRLMDGPLAPTTSVSKYFFNSTPLSQNKKILKVFSEIRNYISSTLEKTKISDLI